MVWVVQAFILDRHSGIRRVSIASETSACDWCLIVFSNVCYQWEVRGGRREAGRKEKKWKKQGLRIMDRIVCCVVWRPWSGNRIHGALPRCLTKMTPREHPRAESRLVLAGVKQMDTCTAGLYIVHTSRTVFILLLQDFKFILHYSPFTVVI